LEAVDLEEVDLEAVDLERQHRPDASTNGGIGSGAVAAAAPP
jgi:hypothetical protein